MFFRRRKKQKADAAGSSTPQPSFEDWLRQEMAGHPVWFHRMALRPDLVTPGFSDPAEEKLPFFGLPDDLEGLRVLDVGAAEGFFSFEAERRGAAEVVAIEPHPDSMRRFQLARAALGSKAMVHCTNVYDLHPRTHGTFDLVLFYGVLYHLRHPLLALERLREVCTGTILVQCACHEEPGLADRPFSRFYPHGMEVRWPGTEPSDEPPPVDPTIFFMPNRACVRAFVSSVGFEQIETVSEEDTVSIVLRAESPEQRQGRAPDPDRAPWS